MDLTPILTAAPVIQLHASMALIALALGPIAILRPRRDRLHKVLGYIWLIAMATAALSSFWIHSFALVGPFSPIHLLAILALWSIWASMRAAFRRDFRLHALVLRNLYWRGLVIAGLLNFLPGRTTNQTFFADTSEAGYLVIGLGATLILGDMLRQRLGARPAQPRGPQMTGAKTA